MLIVKIVITLLRQEKAEVGKQTLYFLSNGVRHLLCRSKSER